MSRPTREDLIVLDVTLAKDTIHNPSEPRHFMAVEPVVGRIRLRLGDIVLAESRNALRLMEVGYRVYTPVIYLPRSDVKVALVETAKETHCPLEGRLHLVRVGGPKRSEHRLELSYPVRFCPCHR